MLLATLADMVSPNTNARTVAAIACQLGALTLTSLALPGCEERSAPTVAPTPVVTFPTQSRAILEFLNDAFGPGDCIVRSLSEHPIQPMASESVEHRHAFGSFDAVTRRYAVREDVMLNYPILALFVQVHEAHHATDPQLSLERRAELKSAVESSRPGSHEHQAALIAMRRYWFEPEVHAFQGELTYLERCRDVAPLQGVSRDLWIGQINALSARAEIMSDRYRMNVICTEVQSLMMEVDQALAMHAPKGAVPAEAVTLLQRVREGRAMIDSEVDQPSDDAVLPRELMKSLDTLHTALSALLALPELQGVPGALRASWEERLVEWERQATNAANEEQNFAPAAAKLLKPSSH